MNPADSNGADAGAPKRGQETTAKILRAALELGNEIGFDALTVERLAERTGVAKTTIYRRWTNISTVVMDAFLAKVDQAAPIVECATARESFAVSMKFLAGLYRSPHGHTLRILIGRAQVDSELRNAVTTRWVEPRRKMARSIVRRGIETKELRAGLDPDLVLDLLYGPIYHRMLVPYENVDLSDAYIDELLDAVFTGLAC
ncbi:TetR family transcriptional regulator [Mycobacterium saskatchewanense]|uniref:TetR family transcriptional regulator n=1 Tax=Mycobacterium saskatchewanense TaxID=220927 RepID=A0AAJ3NPI4_9MYCO|nr:TetR/AcrR family transcriptional regulator [Mycobacterium saskatchewanense]ORW70555.1 TetR family transcriptional regulator [Mycobacterium saskatchewanense]BBX64283.1 TetR family transcriptional regulator [Mycobacterium saskatchewanense]